MAPNPEHFAVVVRRERRVRELTQEQLAHRSGVSLSTLIAVESGRSAFWQTLAVLAQALGIRFSELVAAAEKLAEGAATSQRFLESSDTAPVSVKSTRSSDDSVPAV